MQNIINMNSPNYDIKSVILFYHGKFPSNTMMTKDATLPQRLFPNAYFYIRCIDTDLNTKLFFKEHFKNFQYELVPQNSNVLNLKADLLFLKYEMFVYYGGKIERYCIDINETIQKWKNKLWVFYNDEYLGKFDILTNQIMSRKDKFHYDNAQGIAKCLTHKTDYSNISVLANQNLFCDWMKYRISDYLLERGINTIYLHDKILYDLPKFDESILKTIPYNKRHLRGMYVAFMTMSRASTWNKIFTKDKMLDLFVGGTGTGKLKTYNEHDGAIDNEVVKQMYNDYDYSLYLGKGTESLYLGATFYEPLLAGIPIFVWIGTDPQKKIFGNMECYFNNDSDLKQLIEKYESNELDLTQLYNEQIKKILL